MLSTLVVQLDGTIVADSLDPFYEQVREQLLRFSDLVYRVERLHMYRMSRLTLWQAAARGMTARSVLEVLRRHSEHGIPYEVQQQVVTDMGWWGRIRLVFHDEDNFALTASSEDLKAIADACKLPKHLKGSLPSRWVFPMSVRASVKQTLAQKGFPCVDELGYQRAAPIELSWRANAGLRDYQAAAVESFLSADTGQSGVVVLPCGAGKTLVGIGAMVELDVETLIFAPTDTACNQWRQEILEKTTIHPSQVGMYRETGKISPVTIATYHRVAAANQKGTRRHFATLSNHRWGLVIYDEVHMLPAPLFRLAADMQSVRRLGLTATLIREDGAETDVFSLIGPKCYEAAWKDLEQQGYLAKVRCVEVRVPLPRTERETYESTDRRHRHKMAALNSAKLEVLMDLARVHVNDSVLVIGHYLDHLYEAAELLSSPVVTGKTPLAEREHWFEAFRNGSLKRLVLSRVANMSVDIPCASVIIQLSGLYGSRQEEAQRLGRLLRPDSGPGVFYTVVTNHSVEADMSRHRSLFLIEQGYHYEVIDGQLIDPINHSERMIQP